MPIGARAFPGGDAADREELLLQCRREGGPGRGHVVLTLIRFLAMSFSI